MADTLHGAMTRNRGLSYLFTDKHHGGGTSKDACWCVTKDEEFAVFDLADLFDLRDDGGRFFGVLPDETGELRDLGTKLEQVAEFPLSTSGVWHGYPSWPLSEGSQRQRPGKHVFDAMVMMGLMTRRQHKRMMKGKHT